MSSKASGSVMATVALFVSAPAVAGPGHSTMLDYVFTGTVRDLNDATGVFGAARAGDAYRLVYHADFGRGYHSIGGGGSGGGEDLFGGTSQSPWPGAPGIQQSPVSATLTIDGHRLDFAGLNLGEAQYGYGLGGPMGNEIHSGGSFTAKDVMPGMAAAIDQISSFIEANMLGTFTAQLVTPLSVTIDGSVYTGSTSFTYGLAGGTGRFVSGDLTEATYAGAVPALPVGEPATIAMAGMAMIMGAWVGWKAPRRRPSR